MIPEYQQNIESVLKAASPEQLVLWQHVRLITGQNAALRQLYYQSVAGGSEFLTYINTKLYFAYEIAFSTGGTLTAASNVTFHDTLNNAVFIAGNNAMVWNTTAAQIQYIGQYLVIKNIIFSRIVLAYINYIKFTGYRIIY